MRKPALVTTLAIFIALFLGLSAVHGQEGTEPETRRPAANMGRMLVRLIDLNNDGKISGAEHMKFFNDADQDKDGFISQKELTDFMNKRRRERSGRDRQEAGGPEVGQKAPEFTLKRLDGEGTVKLSDYIGEKPVVLVFGSYT